MSVSRTEPIDRIQYMLHAHMMQFESLMGAPSIRMPNSRLLFKAASVPSQHDFPHNLSQKYCQILVTIQTDPEHIERFHHLIVNCAQDSL